MSASIHIGASGIGIIPDRSAVNRQSRTGEIHFPAIKKWTQQIGEPDPRLAVLFALASKDTLPITQEQEDVLDRFYSISKTTKKYLGPIGYSIVIGTAIIGGLAGVRLARYSGIPDESPSTDAIPFAISAVAATVLAVASMLFTGTFPDQKSDAADKVVEILPEIEHQFNAAAMCLLSLIWSAESEDSLKAIELAKEIEGNLPSIQEKLKQHFQTDILDEKIVRVLKAVVDYIRSSGTKNVLLYEIEDRIALYQLKTGSSIPPCFAQGAAAPLLEGESDLEAV